MQAVILYCKPRARFHFGKVAPDNNTSLNDTSEWLHSDTLFSAIVNTLALVYEKPIVDRIIGHFQTGAIRISSGYYLLKVADRDIYFLPKPANLALEVTNGFKDYNKVKFISRNVWELGLPFSEWKNHCYFLQNGAFVVTKSELPELTMELQKREAEINQKEEAAKISLFNVKDFPRVKVHTQGQQDAFFYLATICIADKDDLTAALPDASVHYYFIFDTKPGFEKEDDFKCIMTAFNLLPDQGIGGERSAGCGLFTQLDIFPFDSLSVQGSTQQCSVSLTLPNSEEELEQMVAYQILTRGGRVHSGGKLNFVRLMVEGAVAESKIEGRIANIGNTNPEEFLRYGKALCLPVRAILNPKI